MASLSMPKLIVTAEGDWLVDPSHGRALARAAAQPVEHVHLDQPGALHADGLVKFVPLRLLRLLDRWFVENAPPVGSRSVDGRAGRTSSATLDTATFDLLHRLAPSGVKMLSSIFAGWISRYSSRVSVCVFEPKRSRISISATTFRPWTFRNFVNVTSRAGLPGGQVEDELARQPLARRVEPERHLRIGRLRRAAVRSSTRQSCSPTFSVPGRAASP